MIATETETLTYSWGGLFVSDKAWIHPERIEATYEMIYMVRGNAYMHENGVPFTLKQGDVKVLLPHIPHGGVEVSSAPTSFYWLHFYLEGDLGLPQGFIAENFTGGGMFPELLHLQNSVGCKAAEPGLLHLLIQLRELAQGQNKNQRFVNRVLEWVRIHTDANLSVETVAKAFGYHPEYLSKLVKHHTGVGLKNVISKELINRANQLLDNTTDSVKEIAAQLSFADDNLFVNFYKYHTHTTPTKYRNRNFKVHMNNR